MKTTTKKPKKSAPKAAPAKPTIHLSRQLRFEDAPGRWIIRAALEARPASLLKEDLRARGIKIPKDKDDMVTRLSTALLASGAVLTLDIVG